MAARKRSAAATTDTKQGKDVKLPALQIQRMTVRVKSLSPLIVNAFSVKSKEEMAAKQQKQARLAKEAKDPVACFNAARYVVNGKDCVTAITVKKAIMTAATFADEFKSHIGMALFVRGSESNGDFIPIKSAKPRMREDVVRVGTMTKTADLRYRPEYVDWKMEFVVEFNARVLTADQVLNLVSIAGFSCGICEWRPQKGGGDYGRFELDMKGARAGDENTDIAAAAEE